MVRVLKGTATLCKRRACGSIWCLGGTASVAGWEGRGAGCLQAEHPPRTAANGVCRSQWLDVRGHCSPLSAVLGTLLAPQRQSDSLISTSHGQVDVSHLREPEPAVVEAVWEDW
jgi:hypothetical protein